MAPKLASEGGKGGVIKYFVPGHLLGSSRLEMEKCSVMRPGGSLGIHSNLWNNYTLSLCAAQSTLSARLPQRQAGTLLALLQPAAAQQRSRDSPRSLDQLVCSAV